jgi:hypothetical protein
MTKDNSVDSGESGELGDNANNGASNDNANDQKLSLEDIKKAMLEKAGLSADDMERVFDSERSSAVNSFKKKSEKDQKASDKAKAEEEAAKKAQENIEKLKGAERDKAEADEKLRQANLKEQELMQRECRAHCTAANIQDLPEGLKFDSVDSAKEFVAYMKAYKPASKNDAAPGRPKGDVSTKPKSEDAKLKEDSVNFLGSRFPWMKPKKE